MNRIDRVTAILIQLQSKKIVKAQDIAERFGISLRTVYRDVKTLEQAGIPILGEAGVGYSIMEGYRLPPVMFTKEEATAFLTAEKLVEKFTDSSTETSYKSAMYKVRSVLRSAEKDLLENIDEQIAVLRKYTPFDNAPGNNLLQTLLRGASEKQVLHIHYAAYNSNETTQRDIEPIGIFYSSGFWHTIAYCRLRKDYRDFRTDRIQQINTTSETFRQEHPSLKEYLEQMSREQDLQTVVVLVQAVAAKYLQTQKYYYGFIKEEKTEEGILMTFLVELNDYFLRWFVSFADHARIISPLTLKERLKRFICTVAEKNS
jgi:predicted DNA-binding transcriptional regulator YafY